MRKTTVVSGILQATQVTSTALRMSCLSSGTQLVEPLNPSDGVFAAVEAADVMAIAGSVIAAASSGVLAALDAGDTAFWSGNVPIIVPAVPAPRMPAQTVVGDIRFLQQLNFPAYAVNLDWLMTDQNLIAEGYDLQSAVIVALGTDALAPISEPLPDPDDTDRRGWWADMDAQELWGGWPVGCLLWLMRRAKITGPEAQRGSTVARADGWTRDAMKPFTTQRIASRIDVMAERADIGRIDVAVAIYRGPEQEIELRYSDLWQQLVEG